MMARRHAWICLALWVALPSSASIQAPGRTFALIVTSTAADAAGQQLESHLNGSYGVEVMRLDSNAASAPLIESALLKLADAATRRDTILLHFALPVEVASGGFILATTGYSVEEPWSGLPLPVVERLALGLRAQRLLVTLPICERLDAPPPFASFQYGSVPVDFAMVTHCDFLSPPASQGAAFTDAMAQALARFAAASGGGELPAAELFGDRFPQREGVRFKFEQVPPGRESGLVFLAREPDLRASIERYEQAGSDEAGQLAALEHLRDALERERSAGADPNPEVVAFAESVASKETAPERHRLLAVEALVLMGDPGAGALARLAQSSNGPVRARSVDYLGNFEGEGGRLALERVALLESDPTVQKTAVLALGRRKEAQSADAIARLARSAASAGVRATAVQVLSSFERPADAALFEEALSDDAAVVRTQAIGALARLPPNPERTTRILTMLDDPAPAPREAAALAIGRVRGGTAPGQAAEALVRAVEVHPDLQEPVLWALGEIKDARATPIARKALQTGPDNLRIAATRTLGKLQSQEALAEVLEATDPESPIELRRAAVWALGEIGGEEATVRLRQLAGSGDPQDAVLVKDAESALDVARESQPLETRLRDTSLAVRLKALEEVAATRPRSALPLLSQMLGDQSAEVRVAAAKAIRSFDEHARTGALVGALDDPTSAVRRQAAAQLLGEIRGDRRAAEALLRHAEDPDAGVRAEVVRAYSQRREDDAREMLLRATEDRDANVRAAAVAGLSGVPDPRVRRRLIEVANEDPSKKVRLDALEALGARSSSSSR